MVEKTHTAGWLPGALQPLRHLQERVADWFAPRSEASAAEDCFEITLELPGVEAEDIDVSVDGNSLIVSGEKRTEREDRGRTYYFSEREYGAFQRTFRLPPDADTANIEATSGNGVLTLKIAKQKSVPESAQKIVVRRA
jgi:HSP20 family protein